MKNDHVVKGVSSVVVKAADDTTYTFDVEDFTIVADDGEPEYNYRTNYEKYSVWPKEVTYAIRGNVKPEADGIAYRIQLPKRDVVRTARIEVKRWSSEEIVWSRKALGVPAQAYARHVIEGGKSYVEFEWKDEVYG